MNIICPHCGVEFSTGPKSALGDARIALKLGLIPAAEKLGISARQLSRYERGIGEPSLEVARKAVTFYGQPMDVLFPPKPEEAPVVDETEERMDDNVFVEQDMMDDHD